MKNSTFILFGLVCILGCSSDYKNQILGTWKTTKFETKNVKAPEPLIQKATELALVTEYTFNDNNTFVVFIRETDLDPAQLYSGNYTLKANLIRIEVNRYEISTKGEWINIDIEENEKRILSIESSGANRLVLKEKDQASGSFIYSLEFKE